MERGRDNRRRSVPGSYSFTFKHTAEDECIGIYGIPKREEQSYDIPEVREYEICIPKQRILVPRILRRHGGKKHGSNKGIHSKSIKGG